MPRNEATPIIMDLLKRHDSIPDEMISERNAIKRQILFIMQGTKLGEAEDDQW